MAPAAAAGLHARQRPHGAAPLFLHAKAPRRLSPGTPWKRSERCRWSACVSGSCPSTPGRSSWAPYAPDDGTDVRHVGVGLGEIDGRPASASISAGVVVVAVTDGDERADVRRPCPFHAGDELRNGFFPAARLFHDLQLSPVVHAQQRLDVQHAAHGGGSRAVSSVPDIPDEKPRYSTSYPLWSASSNAAR